MKRIVSVVLFLFMLTIQVCSYAALDYTLPEKMKKQLDFGSGLKGSIILHGEGDDPILSLIHPFQDAELQFRGLRSGEKTHYYIYQSGENEAQRGLTELFNDGRSLFFRSDMLPGDVFRLPGLEDLSDQVFSMPGGNPSIASAVLRWLKLSEEERDSLLSPVITRLSGQLEVWVAQFAEISPVRTLQNGISVIDSSYVIPMAELRKEIISLLNSTAGSTEGKRLFDALLNDPQKALFANDNLNYFYNDAMKALDNDFDLTYTRTITIFGEPVSSVLELPLADSGLGYQSVLIENRDGMISYTLRGEDRLITLQIADSIRWEQIDGFSAWIYSRPNPASDSQNEGLYHSYRLDVSCTKDQSTDEESRDHERIGWTIQLQGDTSRLPEEEKRDHYPEEIPVLLDLKLHYFSRYSQSSPTTLEVNVLLEKENLSLSAAGQFKTASPWVFSPFNTENTTDLLSLGQSEIELKIAEFLAAAAETLIPDALPAPEENHDSEPEQSEETFSAPSETGSDEPDQSAAVEGND